MKNYQKHTKKCFLIESLFKINKEQLAHGRSFVKSNENDIDESERAESKRSKEQIPNPGASIHTLYYSVYYIILYAVKMH